MRVGTIGAFALLLCSGCRFGSETSFDVVHGYADKKVMASDPEGEHVLTSDVDGQKLRIFDRDGTPVGTLPWLSLGYGGEVESGRGPYNGAATAYGAAGFYVAGGDDVIHWVFPLLGSWATINWDTVPPIPESSGRVKVCDITSGGDGSVYVLSGERTNLGDSWARGAAWIQRRDANGTWTRKQLAVHTFYISSLCGYVAYDVVSDRVLMLDQVAGFARRLKPDLSADGTIPVTSASTVQDMETLAGSMYLAYCSGTCGGDTELRILNEDGAVTDARLTGNVHAMTVERPPLPLGNDQEAFLWTVGENDEGALTKFELLTE